MNGTTIRCISIICNPEPASSELPVSPPRTLDLAGTPSSGCCDFPCARSFFFSFETDYEKSLTLQICAKGTGNFLFFLRFFGEVAILWSFQIFLKHRPTANSNPILWYFFIYWGHFQLKSVPLLFLRRLLPLLSAWPLWLLSSLLLFPFYWGLNFFRKRYLCVYTMGMRRRCDI